MDYKEFLDSFLPSLQAKYVLNVDENTSNEKSIVLRSTISSGVESEKFMKDFSEITDTKWIVFRSSKDCSRLIYRKVWICHLSSHRKKDSSNRNLQCNARISIIVKKLTNYSRKKDPYLAAAIPLCAKIVISVEHTHDINAADSLNLLRVSDEIQKQFYSYFDDGINPKTAKRYHENMLLMSETYLEDLANAAKNPTDRQVYYMYDKWREINLGPVANPFEKLQEKKHLYEQKGATLHLDIEGTWAILIVSALMKRVHTLPASSEIVFLDTTASCEGTNASLTIMLVASKAGAVPIAVFLHESQTTDSYVKAFSMLKTHFPLCFGGKDFPAVFMTDDSKAEKNALTSVWGKSSQLLCHFHVAQAEWRWIHCSKDVPKELKPLIMKHFQAIMYATSEDDLIKNYETLLCFAEGFPSYVQRLKSYFERRKEWTLCDRQNLIIRGHNTNNFAEASIRIIKDIVLCRTKAFNVVALTDFVLTVWENFLTLKLLDFANGRRNSLLYSRMNKTYNVSFCDCIQLSPHMFLLPSESDSNLMYEVNVDGFCTCPQGRTGAFCKHQCFLFRELKINLPNAPILSSNDRLQLAFLGTGKRDLNKEFYDNFKNIPLVAASNDFPHENESLEENIEVSITNATNEHIASFEKKEQLLDEFKRLLNFSHSKNSVKRLTEILRTKRNPEEMKGIMTTMSLAVRARNYKRSKEKKIKIQPTSLSRRRIHIPRSILSKKLKKAHNISKNIRRNIPNAK